jgi:hypothetical protein
MKSHSPGREAPAQAKAPPQEPARKKPPEYNLEASWYCTMKTQRVYPLVVQVPSGRGSVPIDSPSGVMVMLRPIVSGALVTPAELPLELSRPGAQATFHVTPLARGRLPEARVRVFHGGQQVHELPLRMVTKTQRLAWVLLLLALVVPALLIHYTRYEPLRGSVKVTRPVTKNDAAEQSEVKTEEWYRPGSPGEVLRDRVGSWLRGSLPEFTGSEPFCDGIASGVGTVYEYLCVTAGDVRPAFWLGVLLLLLSFGSWVLHRPARISQRGPLVLVGALSSVTLHGDATAETLPLTAPPGEAE